MKKLTIIELHQENDKIVHRICSLEHFDRSSSWFQSPRRHLQKDWEAFPPPLSSLNIQWIQKWWKLAPPCLENARWKVPLLKKKYSSVEKHLSPETSLVDLDIEILKLKFIGNFRLYSVNHLKIFFHGFITFKVDQYDLWVLIALAPHS